jgi:hypothetical protein
MQNTSPTADEPCTCTAPAIMQLQAAGLALRAACISAITASTELAAGSDRRAPRRDCKVPIPLSVGRIGGIGMEW